MNKLALHLDMFQSTYYLVTSQMRLSDHLLKVPFKQLKLEGIMELDEGQKVTPHLWTEKKPGFIRIWSVLIITVSGICPRFYHSQLPFVTLNLSF